MTTYVIWQSPGDAADKIEYNDDDTNAEYYRFRSDTGFELTIKRDATNTRTIASVSGSTWPGILELNGNGEIWAKGDLKIKIDSDGGGANKLQIVTTSGLSLLEVDEAGTVSAALNYQYTNPKSGSAVIYPHSYINFPLQLPRLRT